MPGDAANTPGADKEDKSLTDRMIPAATAEKAAFNVVWARSNPPLAYQVYLLRNEKGEPLYVGVSSTLRHRVYDHWRRKPWGKEIASVEVLAVGHGRYAGELAERTAIRRHMPRYNTMHNRPGSENLKRGGTQAKGWGTARRRGIRQRYAEQVSLAAILRRLAHLCRRADFERTLYGIQIQDNTDQI